MSGNGAVLKVKSDCIDIWYGELSDSEEASRANLFLLDVEERRRAERFKFAKLRNKYINSQSTLRKLLARYTGVNPEAIQFGKGQYGKPFLVGNDQLHFNLSHSGQKIAVAIGSLSDLGVDIETWNNRTHLLGLVNKCFAESEKAYWQMLPEEKKLPAFYAFWTKKESFVKAVGRGIALGVEKCVVSPQHPSEFISIPDGFGDVSQWRALTLQLGEGISGALSIHSRSHRYKMYNLSCCNQ